MNGFLICPARGADPERSRAWLDWLETNGWKIHWPPRDTKQDGDPSGIRICNDNLAAIKAAAVVFIIWDGKSQGCLFDAGMAFALRKPMVHLELPDATDGKSFQNMFEVYSGQTRSRVGRLHDSVEATWEAVGRRPCEGGGR